MINILILETVKVRYLAQCLPYSRYSVNKLNDLIKELSVKYDIWLQPGNIVSQNEGGSVHHANKSRSKGQNHVGFD